YDQNLIAVCERVADHVARPAAHHPRQRIWWVRAKQVVLGTGAIERPIVFAQNDVPGVMLASAVKNYALQHGVKCGKRAVVFTNNNSAYETVTALRDAGVEVAAVVDSRQASEVGDVNADLSGVEVLHGHVVVGTRGSKQVTAVNVMRFDGQNVSGDSRRIECDLLCVSGGWNPTVHLFSQSQGKLRFDDDIAAFVPGESRQAERSAGACKGTFNLAACLDEGLAAGEAAASDAGYESDRVVKRPDAEGVDYSIQPLWQVPNVSGNSGKRFADVQNDVTADDVGLAAREGYESVEHLKRYTTLGMGTDQGRTSNVNGLAILANTLGKDIPSVGTTTFRPPFSPVTMGAIGGSEVREHFAPLRRTAMHDWHLRHGAQMVNAGLWQRAQFYPLAGEEMMETIWRETKHVRKHVGVVDVSTLGKIEIQGRDAAEFLERVYINKWKSLKVGRARYGLMLREDGFLLDDGTTTRVSENEYYMTTTTANAGPVMAHLEYYAQTVWPELHVHLTSVSDQWAGLALAGPHARDVLAAAVDGADVSNDGLPFMGLIETTISDMPVRLFRITFSGELAYEIHMPSDYGEAVWQAVLDAGQSWNIEPYGTEALSILRIEKGHVVAAELDGRTIPADFGFAGMQKKESDFIGKRSLEREALQPERRKSFVGLISESGEQIPRGSQIVENPSAPTPIKMLGHVSSQCYSPHLEKYIGLALIENASQFREDDKVLYAASPLADKNVPVRVVHHVFIDSEGERCRG
ncbi:MAG: sarcosine oxidase subunit alpha family protein, partial [Gammaproteobacteria bacterium]|nr:sarcosine oxidase subunit alpha family protein [Gammaproteobacteria bacterium]